MLTTHPISHPYSGVTKGRTMSKIGETLTNLGSNSKRENNYVEETPDILIQRELQWQATGFACAIMGGNLYVLDTFSKFWLLTSLLRL